MLRRLMMIGVVAATVAACGGGDTKPSDEELCLSARLNVLDDEEYRWAVDRYCDD
jgi:hypothetical protein